MYILPLNLKAFYFILWSLFKTLAPQKVEREPYDGPVVEIVQKVEEAKITQVSPQKSGEDPFLHRPPTRGGGRNMQESSFAFSGKFTDPQAITL